MSASASSVVGEKKHQRQTKWDDLELLTLAAFVKENQARLFGSGGGHGVEAQKTKAWEEAATKVMAARGKDRGGAIGVRKKWSDAAYRAKKYRRQRTGINITGGGPQPPFNASLEAVLDALPDVVTEGIVSYGECDSIPQTSRQFQIISNSEVDDPAVSPVVINTESIVSKATDPVDQGLVTESVPGSDMVTDTESSQSQEEQGARVKRKSQQPDRKLKKKAKTGGSISKERDLLEMNVKFLEIEREKMKNEEKKIALQEKLISTLEKINDNLEKLISVGLQVSLPAEQ